VGRVPCYYLKIGRRQDQLSFANCVGFTIHRKRQKMLIALELLQRLGPLEAGAEWQRIFEKRGRVWVMRDTGGYGAPDEI